MANKGGNYEREVCKQLSLWWTEGARDDIFWRSQTSGGRATQRAKKKKKTSGQYGDVAATDPIGFPLVNLAPLEIKRGYPKAVIHDLFDVSRTTPKFKEWIEKLKRTAKKAKAPFWLLITRRDYREAMIWMPFELHYLTRVIGNGAIPVENYFSLTRPTNPIVVMCLKNGTRPIFGCRLELWLKNTSPFEIKRLALEML